MTEYVLDASALLSILFEEQGREIVLRHIDQSIISAVNFSESLTKMIDRGQPLDNALLAAEKFDCRVIAFDKDMSIMASSLRPITRHLGLSFADRACLALGLKTDKPILTADARLAKAEIGIRIECIR